MTPRLYIILFLLFTLVACNNTPTLTNPATARPATRVFSLSATPILPSPTITPIQKTPTATSTMVPIRTSQPIVSGAAADKIFQDWLTGSASCRFPCWAGVTPGKTTWDDARYKLRHILQRGGIPLKSRCRFGECDVWGWNFYLQNGESYDGVFFGKEGILYSIAIAGKYTSDVDIKRLFEIYGQPSQIFVLAISDYGGDPPILETVIVFTNFNFVIRYTWQAKLEGINFVACGQPRQFALGIVALDENDWTIEEMAGDGRQYEREQPDIWRLEPIENVTGMTVTSFYEKVLQSKSGFCITTP